MLNYYYIIINTNLKKNHQINVLLEYAFILEILVRAKILNHWVFQSQSYVHPNVTLSWSIMELIYGYSFFIIEYLSIVL